MGMSQFELVAFIRTRLTAEARLVAIDACGGSGKTTLAAALAREMSAQIVHVDDFFRSPSTELERAEDELGPAGHRFDLDRLRTRVLAPLRTGLAVRPQRYDWETDRLVAGGLLVPDTLTIVEGVYALRRDLRSYYDLSVWIETDASVRLARGLARDGESARQRWVRVWMPEEEAYVDEQSPQEAAMIHVDATGHADAITYQIVRA